jgi:hypothetical protein
MAETKTQRKAVARRKPAAKTATRRRPVAASRSKTAVDRTTKLSEEVLQSVESGQRAAIEAVGKFVDTVERVLPRAEGPIRRQEIVESALEMADRLIHTQYDFSRKVVDSAGRALNRPGAKK